MNPFSPSEFEALNAVSGVPVDGIEPQGLPLQHLSVVMIDDEVMMTDVIQTYLEDAGYRRLVAVNDPRQALQVLREQRPGLVLLDLVMPGLSGFEILTEMRRDALLRYVPVIVLTAATDPATRLRALELGATEFLSKPVDASELVLRVRNSLVFKVYQDRLANLDLLTGLPNRRVFVERLRTAIATQPAGCLALMHVGLDRFRLINDSLGPSGGDQLLIDVGARLASCLRRGDGAWYRDASSPLLSRLGGDEFGVLLPSLPDPGIAERIARRVLHALATPFFIDGQEVYATASIGLALHPGDGLDDEALRRSAELARAQAKQAGRNTFRYPSSASGSDAAQRLNLETRLRTAIARQELALHFQPKVDLGNGRIVGAEALLRWFSPELGAVPPARFIPLAEECGLIGEIGEWVLEEACSTLARWRSAHPALAADLAVAVNVARQQVNSGQLLAQVKAALAQHGLPPQGLVLELTESMLMDPQTTIQQQFSGLRALGVRLSIDDFGTGYSSMNYLRKFPLDELKIDKSFVDGIPGDHTNLAIVRAMVVLAHSLGMRAVAEGVEHTVQREVLAEIDCDLFQGYLCSHPLPEAAFLDLLAAAPAAGAPA